MKFNKKETSYIVDLLGADVSVSTDAQFCKICNDWLTRETEQFEDDSIEVLESRISETEALQYHDKCSPTFEAIKSLRIKAQSTVLTDKIDEKEAIAEVLKAKAAAKKAVKAKAVKAKKSSAKVAKKAQDAPESSE